MTPISISDYFSEASAPEPLDYAALKRRQGHFGQDGPKVLPPRGDVTDVASHLPEFFPECQNISESLPTFSIISGTLRTAPRSARRNRGIPGI